MLVTKMHSTVKSIFIFLLKNAPAKKLRTKSEIQPNICCRLIYVISISFLIFRRYRKTWISNQTCRIWIWQGNTAQSRKWNLFGIHLVGTWNPNVCQSQSSKSWTTGLSISSGTVFPSELCVNSILGIGRPSIWRRSATAALICILQSMWNSYYMWYFLKQSKWNLKS